MMDEGILNPYVTFKNRRLFTFSAETLLVDEDSVACVSLQSVLSLVRGSPLENHCARRVTITS